MNKTVHSKVLELYKDLIKLDPLHSQYYKDQHSLVFLREVILSSPCVVKHNPQSFMDMTLIVDGAAACAPQLKTFLSGVHRLECFKIK